MDPTQWDAPFGVVVAALFIIVCLRAGGTYLLGRLIARGAHRTRAARLMDAPGYLRAADRLNRWGAPFVTLSFLTVGVQTLVNLAAGAAAMPLRRYLPALGVGGVIWALVYATVGLAGLEAFGRLWERSPALAWAVAALALGALATFVVLRVRDAHRRRADVHACGAPAASEVTASRPPQG